MPPPVRAVGYRGMARGDLGDAAGLDEMREALELAKDAGQAHNAAVFQQNLGLEQTCFNGPRVALRTFQEGLAFAEARGLTEMALGLAVAVLESTAELGDLDRVLETAPQLISEAEAAGNELDLCQIRCTLVRVLVLRGEPNQVSAFLAPLESIARENGQVADLFVGCLAAVALARHALGEGDAAAALVQEIVSSPVTFTSVALPAYLPAITRMALEVGRLDLAEGLLNNSVARQPYGAHSLVAARAAVAEDRGEMRAAIEGYADATERWEAFGHGVERGFALLGHGRCLLSVGHTDESSDALRRARQDFDRLRAQPAIRETDSLLAQATALSS